MSMSLEISKLSFITSKLATTVDSDLFKELNNFLIPDLSNIVIQFLSKQIRSSKTFILKSEWNNRLVKVHKDAIVYTDIHGTPEFNQFKNLNNDFELGHTKVISEGGLQKIKTKNVLCNSNLTDCDMELIFVKENIKSCLRSNQSNDFVKFINNKIHQTKKRKNKIKYKKYLSRCGYTRDLIKNSVKT